MTAVAEQPAAETAAAATPKKPARRAQKADSAPRPKKAAKKATAQKNAPKREQGARSARTNTKAAQVVALLQRAKGATLDELMKATGWQAHSVRGFLSGALSKRMGLKLESAKREDGVRVYSVAS